jgi:hypothetical protein
MLRIGEFCPDAGGSRVSCDATKGLRGLGGLLVGGTSLTCIRSLSDPDEGRRWWTWELGNMAP